MPVRKRAMLAKKGSKRVRITKRGLTAKAKTEVKKIAKSAITNVAEKKFMNSAQFNGVLPNSSESDTISVLGFSSTNNRSPNQDVLTYGSTEMREQLCLRPFGPDRGNDTPDADTSNHIIGKECKPVSCFSRWRIARMAGSMDQITSFGDTGITGEGLPGASPDQYPQGLAESCPVVCRMIRVVCKNLAGTATEYNPTVDLFLNTRGDAFGVDDSDFNQKEMLFLKVNNRRYTVLDDTTFTLQNPLTVNYTWAQRQTPSSSNAGWWVPQVSNGSANCEKYINMNHMLTQKKHGSVYYPEPITSIYNNAVVGQRREFTLFHFMYKGADNIVGQGLVNQGPISDIKVDLVNITKFIDV